MPWFKEDPTWTLATADAPTNRVLATTHPVAVRDPEPSGTTFKAYSPVRQKLGLKYWDAFAYTAPTSADQEVAAGLVWTWASGYSGETRGWGVPFSTAMSPTETPMMRQLTTRVAFHEPITNQSVFGRMCLPLIPLERKSPILPLNEGIEEILSIGRPSGGPVEVFSVAGSKARNVTNVLDTSLRSALGNATWTYVAAGDSAGSWTGTIGAAMVSPDHVVRNGVRHLSTGLTYSAVNPNAGAPTVAQSLPPIAALSGRQQRLAFFGERTAEGVVTNTVRFYDFTSDSRTIVDLEDLAAIQRPQPISNADFESYTLVSWSTSGSVSVVPDPRGTATNSGYVARVGSTDPTLDNTMSQTVTVPSDGRSVLSFAYQVVCPDVITYDQVEVTATDNTNNTVIQLLPQTCTNDGQWRSVEYDLASRAGHSVTLTFRVHDDAYPTDPTYAYFDDIRFHAPVTNGGFESGSLAGWSSTGPVAIVSGTEASDGAYAARVGSTSATNVDGMLRNTFDVPADANALSFKHKIVCLDSVTYDWMRVELHDNLTQADYTILDRTCSNTGAWASAKYAIPPAVRGHNVTVTFKVHDDNYPGDPTYALVDSVTLSSGIAFSDPVAATYRAEDDAYYVLDRATTGANTAVIRLLRISSENLINKIAEWPRSNTATNFGLIAGEDGTLILSAWSGAAWSVTELAVPASGVEIVAQHRGTGSLAAAAWKLPFSGLTAFRTDPNGGPLDPERLADPVNVSIKNGGFDTGTLGSWSVVGSVAPTAAAGYGSPSAQLGSPAGAASSSISQTFTVPPNGTPTTAQTLAFSYRGACPVGSQGSLSATAFDIVTNTTMTVLPATCVASDDWTTVRYSLSASAGHAVTVTFTNTDGGAGGVHASSFVDNVHLELDPALMNTVF